MQKNKIIINERHILHLLETPGAGGLIYELSILLAFKFEKFDELSTLDDK